MFLKMYRGKSNFLSACHKPLTNFILFLPVQYIHIVCGALGECTIPLH